MGVNRIGMKIPPVSAVLKLWRFWREIRRLREESRYYETGLNAVNCRREYSDEKIAGMSREQLVAVGRTVTNWNRSA
jgi:hypothetical protein